MENTQNKITYNETDIALQQDNAENHNLCLVQYISRNKFLKKYHFPATIFDNYIETGRLPFHKISKTVEVEEYRTLAILRDIETKNAEAAKVKANVKPDVKSPVPIILNTSVKIRRKKLDV